MLRHQGGWLWTNDNSHLRKCLYKQLLKKKQKKLQVHFSAETPKKKLQRSAVHQGPVMPKANPRASDLGLANREWNDSARTTAANSDGKVDSYTFILREK